MFVVLTIVTLAILDRSATWLWRLRPVWGLMWLLVLVLPWFVAIFWRAGDAFFTDSIGGDMLSKLAAQESHGAPPGLYLLLFWVTFWPGAPLAGMAAPAVWRARREPGAQFLLAWLVPSWIVFELVLTKLPHYVLPLYPAIAILTVGALERRVLSRSWLKRGAAWWFVIPAGASVIAVVGAITLTRQPVFLAWPFVAAALIFGLFAWWLYDDNRAERSLLNAVVAAMFLAMAVYGVVVPALTPLFPSAEIARALRNVVCVGPKAAAAGFHEPSLVFMTGTSTLLTDGSGAADFLGQGSCRFALVESRSERGFCPARRSHRAALQRRRPASTAIIFRKAGRFRSRSSAPKARSKMSVQAGIGASSNYLLAVFAVALASATQLVRPPSHSRRAEAARRSARHVLLLTAILGAAIIALMYALDAPEIGLMPPRGTASLWPVRILTDFGKSAYVLWLLAGDVVRRRNYFPAIAGDLAIPAARFRDAPAVSVFCRAGAGARRRGHQMDRRARPAVRRRRSQRLQLRALRRNRSLCQLSVGSRHHGELCAGFRGFRGLAAGAARDDGVCHSDRRSAASCCWPIIPATWSRAR